jgi:hypothetical protein
VFLGILVLTNHDGTTRSLHPPVGSMAHWKQRWMSHSLGQPRVGRPPQDTTPPLAPPAVLAQKIDLSMAPPAGPSRSPALHLVPPTYMGGTATPQKHPSLMGCVTQPPFHVDMGGPVPSQGHQYHHPALSRSPSASPSDVPSYVHVSPPPVRYSWQSTCPCLSPPVG